MAKTRSFSDILETLETPIDLDKVKVCKVCGELMHWQPVNKHVGFWIHQGENIRKCADKNPLIKGKPMIAMNLKYYIKVKELWSEFVARQNSRKRQNLH